MKEGYEKYCRNGLCDSKSKPKRYKMDEHRHEDPKDKCWYSGCQCPGERLIIPKEESFKHEIKVLTKEEVMKGRSSAYKFIDFDKPEPHNFLPGLVEQFDPKQGEINGEEWTAVHFLKWLELNKFKIVK